MMKQLDKLDARGVQEVFANAIKDRTGSSVAPELGGEVTQQEVSRMKRGDRWDMGPEKVAALVAWLQSPYADEPDRFVEGALYIVAEMERELAELRRAMLARATRPAPKAGDDPVADLIADDLAPPGSGRPPIRRTDGE